MQDARGLTPRPEYRHTHDERALLKRVVVQEALDVVLAPLVGADFMNQLGSSCAGSIYDNCAAPLPRTLSKKGQVVDTGRKPHQTRRQETYEHVDGEDRPWYHRPDPEHRDSGKQRGASEVTEEDDI